jgi:hypothetical protein
MESHPGQITPALLQKVGQWIAFGMAQFPDAQILRVRQVSLLMAQGKFAEAETLAEAIMGADVPDVQRAILANNLAFHRAINGKADAKTMELIELAIRLLGPRQELLDTRAVAHLVRGDCPDALRDLEAATVFGDSSGNLHFHLALAHQCADNLSTARAALRNAEDAGFSRDGLSRPEQDRYDDLKKWLKF